MKCVLKLNEVYKRRNYIFEYDFKKFIIILLKLDTLNIKLDMKYKFFKFLFKLFYNSFIFFLYRNINFKVRKRFFILNYLGIFYRCII